MTDTICYESYIRYPTDIKLLWKTISWLYPHICRIYKVLKSNSSKLSLSSRFYKCYSIIGKVPDQQQLRFEGIKVKI